VSFFTPMELCPPVVLLLKVQGVFYSSVFIYQGYKKI